MKKIVSFLAVLVVIVVVVDFYRTNKTDVSAKSDKPVVKIGFIYPMTGNASFFGDGAKHAVQLFFEDMKDKKTKNDYEIVFEDSQAQITTGIKAATKLTTLDKVDVIVDCMSGI